jgi:hypothetical protein
VIRDALTYPDTGKPTFETKELIMCYRVYKDAQKDVSKLSSRKEESMFTPREDIDARKATPLMSETDTATMGQKRLTPFDQDDGNIGTKDDFGMKPEAVQREVEKVD